MNNQSEKTTGAPSPEWVEEQCKKFDAVLERFVAEMKAKFRDRAEEGRSRWEDPAAAQRLQDDLVAHAYHAPLAAGEEVNCAVYAAFLWNLRMKRITEQ